MFLLGVGCDDGSSEPAGMNYVVIGGSGGTFNNGTGGANNGTGGLNGGTGGNAVGNGDTVPGDAPWCDALGAIRRNCQGCHGAELAFGAPMPLVTHADTQVASPLDGTTPVYQRIGARIHDANSPMPPVSQPPMSDQDKAAIDAWLAAGADAGPDPQCTGLDEAPMEQEEVFEWPEDCEERYEFRANDNGAPHVIAAGAETHPQFDFNTPWQGEVQAVAIRPITDNKRVLHHWILYESGNFLTGWSPGKGGDLPPPHVGIYMPSSGTLTLDVHYYNVGNNQAEMDQSGVEICVTRTPRPNTAATFPFVGPADAPAGGRTEGVDTCRVEAPDGPVYLMYSSPHMHKLGVHAKLEVIRQNGNVEVIHDMPFNFEDQVTVGLDPEVELRDGDQVRITCIYENPTGTNVAFGTGSDDEMCFNFARYYPSCGMKCAPTTGNTERLIQASQGGGCPSEGGGLPGFGF